jgi:iron complex outermembrane receptor protein
VDLNAAYHFGYVSQSRWARHATVSVNVINIANTDPPYVNIPIGPNGGGGFDPNVGNPIGRIVSLEIQKRF